MKTSKFLVIISVDALNKHDYNFIQTLPSFKSFFQEGAHSKDVESVYPTLTYVAHTSLSTGCYPYKHGIYNNEYPQPEKANEQDWRWFEKDIQSPTFFDYAIKAGLSTASILWPVMAGANLTYNVPEIWSPDDSTSKTKLFLKYGTLNIIWPVIKNSKLLKGTSQPYLDNFTEAVTLDIIKKKINVMAIHFTELDTMRHLYGLNSQEGKDALIRIDKRIGHILEKYKEVGIYDETNFVLLGDHGTADFDHIIELNSLFKSKNMLTTDSNNIITSWQVYACTCGGSVHIHIHEDTDETTRKQIDNLLNRLINKDFPITNLFTPEQVYEKYKLSGEFDYVMEAAPGYVFRNTVSSTTVHTSHDHYKGDHGYLPSHPDQRTLLLMKGPSIKKGAIIDSCRLIDEGPTFSALIGTEMEKVDGRILYELLN